MCLAYWNCILHKLLYYTNVLLFTPLFYRSLSCPLFKYITLAATQNMPTKYVQYFLYTPRIPLLRTLVTSKRRYMYTPERAYFF